jgi:hypothetical protein
MDGPLKELAKLEKLTAGSSGKGKSPSISDSLDSLLHSLHEARDAIQAGSVSPDVLLQLSQTAEAKKKEVEDRQKEIYSSLSRFGKALDKVCLCLQELSAIKLIDGTRNLQRPSLLTRMPLPPLLR